MARQLGLVALLPAIHRSRFAHKSGCPFKNHFVNPKLPILLVLKTCSVFQPSKFTFKLTIMSTAMLQTRISDMEHLFTRAWTDKDILLEALLAPGCGYTVAGARRVRFGHKPLAMLGDAVMKQLIIEQVYAQGATQGKDRWLQLW